MTLRMKEAQLRRLGINVPKRSKYNAKKVCVDGITFDSKAEAKRYQELRLLEKGGAISDLQRQVTFILIPAQYKGKTCMERACKYIADFVYVENGNRIVEDVKGAKTQEYIIKRKLMLYIYGIMIREVR